eukprot:2064467-Prorocentrum_lima.AAC.1
MEVTQRLVVGSLPAPGGDIAKHADNQPPINEPCYVHDAACDGYPVCCVTYGTCVTEHEGTISSNRKYYEGGCQSLDSRTNVWDMDATSCTEQGECHWIYLQEIQNATTKPGFMTDVPEEVTARLMRSLAAV